MRTHDILIGLDDHHTPERWTRRLERDAGEIARRLPPELLELHSTVVHRAYDAGAHGLILSGSTARSRRTPISDLDYHLIGPRLFTRDLSSQLDLHTLTPAELDAHVLAGDDFVQWSLRFGLIVFDDGHLRRAATLIATSRPWPDADRKRQHAAKSVDLARRMVASGDHDAAHEQVRTALSLAARAKLLAAGIFPGARDELPQQLAELGLYRVGAALSSTIHADSWREHVRTLKSELSFGGWRGPRRRSVGSVACEIPTPPMSPVVRDHGPAGFGSSSLPCSRRPSSRCARKMSSAEPSACTDAASSRRPSATPSGWRRDSRMTPSSALDTASTGSV